MASSDFTFESIQIAPAVEIPIPEVQPPAPPVAVTGDTGTGMTSINLLVLLLKLLYSESMESLVEKNFTEWISNDH